MYVSVSYTVSLSESKSMVSSKFGVTQYSFTDNQSSYEDTKEIEEENKVQSIRYVRNDEDHCQEEEQISSIDESDEHSVMEGNDKEVDPSKPGTISEQDKLLVHTIEKNSNDE